jgi:hypothetical protein
LKEKKCESGENEHFCGEFEQTYPRRFVSNPVEKDSAKKSLFLY